MKKCKQKKYFNRKQLSFALAKQKTKVWIGGRGSGKSSVIAFIFYLLWRHLPRGNTAFVCRDLRQAKTKSLSSITYILEDILGLKEHLPHRPGYYVKFKRPPQSWLDRFKPYQLPERWDNCITSNTGHVIELVSMFRGDSNRGGSYDCMIADEAPLLDEHRFWSEFYIMLRAPSYRHAHPQTKVVPAIHQSLFLLGSMPWDIEGYWVPDLAKAAKKEPNKIFYMESTALDNITILGEEYLDNLKKKLPEIVYDVEVLNKRKRKISNCFYSHFGEHNKYRNNEYGKDPYYDSYAPIELSWDFQIGFQCCVVMQEKMDCLTYQNEFFGNENIRHSVADVCDLFDHEYKDHNNKMIILWGDSYGLRKSGNKKSYFQQVIDRLEFLGWTVNNQVTKQKNPRHADKYLLAQKLHIDEDNGCPKLKYNKDKCKFLIISMELAPVKNDNEKDKSSERSQINRNMDTHLSDAGDYGFTPRYNRYLHMKQHSLAFSPV